MADRPEYRESIAARPTSGAPGVHEVIDELERQLDLLREQVEGAHKLFAPILRPDSKHPGERPVDPELPVSGLNSRLRRMVGVIEDLKYSVSNLNERADF